MNRIKIRVIGLIYRSLVTKYVKAPNSSLSLSIIPGWFG